MGADLSRIRSNPQLDFAGVELKQGGVVLDADFNELVAIVDRRLRAAASDILGRGTVSSTTPDAFKITPIASGLQIGKGRLYVDGLLAENHGVPSTVPANKLFNDLMAEVTYSNLCTYATQPYLPSPPALPTSGKHLVYLDVWDREVTHLEPPSLVVSDTVGTHVEQTSLVEVAVGVETSSRRQTVWQVRVLDGDAGTATCDSPDADVPGWSAQIAPSTGRLTTGTFDVSPSDDPCELPPTGGYRGLENQTYRVEIHDPGPQDGTATFKWSRENASVGSRVASMVSATELELGSLGRDDVLRFNTGDWVEIIDDRREFSQLCGEMRKITVNEAARRITFAPDLPADMLPGAFPNSDFPRDGNLRVRRWDQKRQVLQTAAGGKTSLFQDLDAVGSSGVINVPAAGTTLILENGITVSFNSTVTKGFKAGDYWVFAARTSGASVELLKKEPPRGIHHHYARLCIWDAAANTITDDCRNPWPPAFEGNDCACTFCVTADSHNSAKFTLQDAVSQVIKTGGGTVCLEIGTYVLKKPLLIEGAKSLRIAGKGEQTQLQVASGPILIQKSTDVALESFRMLFKGETKGTGVLQVFGSNQIRIEHVHFVVEGGTTAALGLGGALADVLVRGNTFQAPVGIVGSSATPTGAEGGVADLRIENNSFECDQTAIKLSGVSVHQLVSRLTGNRIVNCAKSGVELTGATVPGSGFDIVGNQFQVLGDAIVCGLDRLRIADNDLSTLKPADQRAIFLTKGMTGTTLDDVQIVGNRIAGFRNGIAAQAQLGSIMIARNQIAQTQIGLLLGSVASLGVDENQMSAITKIAIEVRGKAGRVAVRGNQLEIVADAPGVAIECPGGDCVFSDNHSLHLKGGGKGAVTLFARTLIVASNRILGKGAGMDLHPDALKETPFCTVIGNITGGAITLPAGMAPIPGPPINLQNVV
jgi:hypothetical protein